MFRAINRFRIRYLRKYPQQIIAATILLLWFLTGGGNILQQLGLLPNWEVEAAIATVDATVSTTTTDHNGTTPTIVVTSNTTGYAFYKDSGGTCVYSKSTTLDQAAPTWGAAVNVDSQTDCMHISVWYDRWTPGDTTGTYIHIVTQDTGADDLWYNRLDTSSDTLLTAAGSLSAPTGASGLNKGNSFNTDGNTTSIIKATDGTIYMTANDSGNNSDTYVIKCSTTCQTASNWSDTGFSELNYGSVKTNDSDVFMLMPMLGDHVLLIACLEVADDMVSWVYNSTTGTWDSERTTIDATAQNNNTYDGHFSAAVDKQTGKIYMAYGADIGSFSSTSDIRFAVFDGVSTWTSKTEVLLNSATSTRFPTDVSLSIDENNGDIYAVYSARTTAATSTTGNVYWKKSSNEGTTWGTESSTLIAAPATADDIYGVSSNMNSKDRLVVRWYGATPDDVFTNDIFDPTPPTSTYTQAAYRWFANDNATTVTTAQAAANTAYTLTSEGEVIRLRLLIRVATANLSSGAQGFHLQYAGKGAGTCASPSGSPSTYTTITKYTKIAFYNNSTPSDNSALTANGTLDPTDGANTIVNQTYEEENYFVNSQAAINTSQDGKWDFALYDYSGAASTTYCIRAVTYDGTVLGTYSQYPEVTTAAAATYTQSAYRFFQNANSLTVGSAYAAQDTAASLTASDQAFRLKMLIHVGSTSVGAGGANFRLQFAGKGGGTCASPAGTPSTYTDVTTTTALAFSDNASVTDGTTIANVADITHSSDTIVNENYEEAGRSFTNAIAAIPSGQDGKWDFSLIDYNAPTNTTYCLRVVLETDSFTTTALNTYNSYPEVTTSASSGNSIDVSAFATAADQNGVGPTVVFTTDQIGYVFYVNSTGDCGYKKTTDGGTNWSGYVIVDAQTDCLRIGVWYDRWTPGDTTGNYIHVMTMDSGDSRLFYTRLDTSNDSESITINVSSNSSQGGSFTTTNFPSITKGTNGNLYIGVSDASDQHVLTCSSTCTSGNSWTELGTNPMSDSALDNYIILMPLASGNILLIRQTTAGVLASKVWNGTTWDAAWTSIDAAVASNTTYRAGMGAAVNTSNNTIYLVYAANNATLGTDDVKTASYASSTWTSKTAVLSSDARGVTDAKVAVNPVTGYVYTAYTVRTTAATASTGTVYYKASTDGMTSWGSESAAINSSASDLYGLSINIMSDERIYARWFDDTNDDIEGNTVIDISTGPTNDQLMRHGAYFNSSGVEQGFTF